MALIWADCVADTTTTTGTGAVTVSGTPSLQNGQTFSGVCSTNDTFYGRISHQTASEWEEGLYTYSGTNQITRTTVIKSSNSNSAVSFSSGTKNVALVLPASVISTLWNASTGFPVVTTKNANYTFTAADVGTFFRHTDTTGYTWTIDTFANAPIAAGQTISGACESTGTLTIAAPTGGSLIRLDGVSGTGNRTIGANSEFTLKKLDGANAWAISGSSIT